MKRAIYLLTAMLAVVTSPVLAHTGIGSAFGFATGFSHPISGLDHILAMIAVGVLAAQLGGRAIWILPGAFVGMMIVGAVLGIMDIGIPFVELGIVGSVVILGAILAIGGRLPMALVLSLVGILAVFHGHAHGTEMPINAGGLAYGEGFAVATILLHAVGIGIGIGTRKLSEELAPAAVRIGGAAIAATGLALAVS
jgi:urease accessory protein